MAFSKTYLSIHILRNAIIYRKPNVTSNGNQIIKLVVFLRSKLPWLILKFSSMKFSHGNSGITSRNALEMGYCGLLQKNPY